MGLLAMKIRIRTENPSKENRVKVKTMGQTVALFVKRVCDVTVAAVGLITLAPLMALIALLIKLDSRGPILFCQNRIGLGGRSFTIYKFRTMIPGAEKGKLTVLSSDPRVTRLGYRLRSLSLDELPQFINVLKGEMSLIGPRPLLPEQTEKFTVHERKRLQMLPGMTNLPAIRGRNSLTWKERMELDVWYVENWSLLLDIEIFLRSIWVILQQKGVYAPNEQETHKREVN